MLIHAVLESFAAIDEDYWDFVGVKTAEVIVGVYVNFLPIEAGVALKFSQTFFADLAQVASLAGVDHDLSVLVH